MKKISFDVDKNLCGECSLALMRFIGNVEGVESITAENGKVVISFDEAKINEETLCIITKDSIEKLGYKLRLLKNPPRNGGKKRLFQGSQIDRVNKMLE